MPPPRGSWNPIEGPGDYTTTRLIHNDTYPAISPLQHNLTGSAILITGASRGLGRAIAVSFAKAGASYIALAARSNLEDSAKEVKDAAAAAGRPEPRVLNLGVDVSDAGSVRAAMEEVEKEFGKLDVVVNNAGVLGAKQRVIDSEPEAWWETFTTNLRGPYLITRLALPLLLKSDLKTLITISSVGAHSLTPTLSDYQTSKLALTRFTEFLAAEHADEGLVAFSVHPGNMLTDIVGRGEGMDEKFRAVFCDTVELSADGLVYLCGQRRNHENGDGARWLSGRYVNMTWDMPELCSPEMVERVVQGDLLRVKLAVPEVYD